MALAFVRVIALGFALALLAAVAVALAVPKENTKETTKTAKLKKTRQIGSKIKTSPTASKLQKD